MDCEHAHHVLSEVELELAEHAASAPPPLVGRRNTTVLPGDDQSDFTIYTLRMTAPEAHDSEMESREPVLTVTACEDSDGDLDVPRRTTKRRRVSREKEEEDDEAKRTFRIEVRRTATSWDTAGCQIWRAALLLAEYVYATPHRFAGNTVMELGCGIGFAAIVTSRFARLVYATDADVAALELTQRNVDHNHHGNLRLRYFDWASKFMTAPEGIPGNFQWTHNDNEEAPTINTIIASDVFYDDETTEAFLAALHELMLQNSQLTAIVTLERRVVFSAYTMSTILLGFDSFREHLCRHDRMHHTPVSDMTPNQVTCQLCTVSETRHQTQGASSSSDSSRRTSSKPLFAARSIPITDIPHVFQYERVSTLMLWEISAIVNPASREKNSREKVCTKYP